MYKLKYWIENIGMKKLCLFIHYGLAIAISLLFFIVCLVCTFTPNVVDISVLKTVWLWILGYCFIVITYITALSVLDNMQTMNKENTKFDFIAFFIGFSMFVTLGIIIVCIVFMFRKDINENEIRMWQFLIGIFGGMFGVEGVGGYIYKGFKNTLDNKHIDKMSPAEEPPHENNEMAAIDRPQA